MEYVDTSILVAALFDETHTDSAQRWLSGQGAGQLAISDWVLTEFSAALSVKLRSGQIEETHRSEALDHPTLVATQERVHPKLREIVFD